MSGQFTDEPMLDLFIYETSQNIEQLEQLILGSEKENCFSQRAIDEIFRITHTIKGSSAMMLYNDISAVSHAVEDLFFFLREQKPKLVDCSALSDLVLAGADFIKGELETLRGGLSPEENGQSLIDKIRDFIKLLQAKNFPDLPISEPPKSTKLQQYYISSAKTHPQRKKNAFKAVIFFEDGCEMENLRAYSIVESIKDITSELYHFPADIDDEASVQVIREQGFSIFLTTDNSFDEVDKLLNQTVFLRNLELFKLEDLQEFSQSTQQYNLGIKDSPGRFPSGSVSMEQNKELKDLSETQNLNHQNMISVNVTRLDQLMDLVGELVIAEAMVTQNPDLHGLELDNFHKAARQLRKISSELQNVVMSIRMVPLSKTFQKMQRIVRDMGRQLDKEVVLEIIGEETEVDKNIIEHISDPLMHLVRNAIDHGIERNEERNKIGKSVPGKLTLEAKNAGSDVLISVRDDGKGLCREKILEKANKNGLLFKSPTEMSEKEIFNLILLPGFSTKETVSEFSGRGVGMDVVVKNVESVGGTITVESVPDQGTTITLKIPLTLAIIDGMNIRVGNSRYTIPTNSIKESFRPKAQDIITELDGNEIIMVRGQCFPVIRLHNVFKVRTQTTNLQEGILIMVEQDGQTLCIFADELLGQQQVVVKALPEYIKNLGKIRGLAGCTLLGDGNISLILDIGGLIA